MACQDLTPDQMGCINIPILQGNPKTVNIEINDGDSLPIDLSTFDLIKMKIRSIKGNNHDDVVFTISNGLSISGTDNNILQIEFKKDTQSWLPTTSKYDILFVKESENIQQHWFKGMIKVEPTITIPEQS